MCIRDSRDPLHGLMSGNLHLRPSHCSQDPIQHGVVFSNRPAPLPASRFISSNQHNINTAAYDFLCCLLRRNLMCEIVSSPSKILWKPRLGAPCPHPISPNTTPILWWWHCCCHEEHSVCYVCSPHPCMCYGEKLDKKAINDIESANRSMSTVRSSMS